MAAGGGGGRRAQHGGDIGWIPPVEALPQALPGQQGALLPPHTGQVQIRTVEDMGQHTLQLAVGLLLRPFPTQTLPVRIPMDTYPMAEGLPSAIHPAVTGP